MGGQSYTTDLLTLTPICYFALKLMFFTTLEAQDNIDPFHSTFPIIPTTTLVKIHTLP